MDSYANQFDLYESAFSHFLVRRSPRYHVLREGGQWMLYEFETKEGKSVRVRVVSDVNKTDPFKE